MEVFSEYKYETQFDRVEDFLIFSEHSRIELPSALEMRRKLVIYAKNLNLIC